MDELKNNRYYRSNIEPGSILDHIYSKLNVFKKIIHYEVKLDSNNCEDLNKIILSNNKKLLILFK